MPEIDLPAEPRWLSAAARLVRALPSGRYRVMNWIGGCPTPPFWSALPADLGRLQFRCDLRDPLMREVCITGRYEPQETLLLQHLLRPGATFVDVGANWGYFTLAGAALVGPEGRVVSVEADPRGCRTLRANVARNGLRMVIVVEAAADADAGVLTLQSYGDGSDEFGNFGVAATTTVVPDGQRFEIRARPLDEVLDEAGVEQVDLLKMDIEGAESRAFTGLGRRLAAGHVHRILLELHPAHLRDRGDSAQAVVEHLRAYGYQISIVDHSPAMHRRAASSMVDLASLVRPLADSDDLGDWPHVLLTKGER